MLSAELVAQERATPSSGGKRAPTHEDMLAACGYVRLMIEVDMDQEQRSQVVASTMGMFRAWVKTMDLD